MVLPIRETVVTAQVSVLSTIRNILFFLDSIETAEREIKFFFPHFEMKSLSIYENVLSDQLVFNRQTLEHQFKE